MNKKIFYLIYSFIIILVQSCNTTEPGKLKLEIVAEDVSCTEVWIEVKGQTGSEVILKQDDNEVKEFTLTSSPQTVYNDSLLPNTNYTYQVVGNNELSNRITVTTLDSTSHNFSWQTFVFGDADAGSSILNDVTVINDSLIYAAGEIYKNDSLGQPDPQPYGIVQWDNITWLLKKLFYMDKDYQGNNLTIILSNIRSILSTSNNEFWFAAGSVFYWNGITSLADFSYRTLTPSGLQPGINKLWQNSSFELYGVGNSGSIIHYQYGKWNKIESGTDLPFQDIWGDKGEILAIASDKFGSGGQYLISLFGNTAEQIPTNIPTAMSFSSIWFKANRKYFLAGNGVYTKRYLSDPIWELDPIAKPLETYFYSIRGSGLNNIVTVGEGSYIAHFNGISWKVYNELRNSATRLTSVAVTEKMIIAVGYKYLNGIENYGVIYIGRR